MDTTKEYKNSIVSLGNYCDEPDMNLRCEQHPKCQEIKCKEILADTPTANAIRIVAESNIQPLEFYQWERLCGKCRKRYHRWIFGTVWKDRPEKKVSLPVFDKVLKESTYANMSFNARKYYDQLIERLHTNHTNNGGKILRQEIKEQKIYLKDCEEKYYAALKELDEAIKEEQARRAGYEI